jgi:hypothetical protein
VKNSDQPELQKNTTRKALNVDLHKLLGDATFAKYQAVHRRQAQNLMNLKKDTVAPKKSAAAQAAAAVSAGAPSAPSMPKKSGGKKSKSSSSG